MAVLRVSMGSEQWLSASPTFNDLFTDEVVMICGGFPVGYDTKYVENGHIMVVDFQLPPMTLEQLDGLIRYTASHPTSRPRSAHLMSVIY
jgi:hypothetical protein